MEDKKMLNDEELNAVTGGQAIEGRQEGYYYCPHCGAQHTFEQTKCCHCRSCKIPTNFEDASGRLLDD